MRTAKRSKQPGASDFLRGVKGETSLALPWLALFCSFCALVCAATLDEQAHALNVEAKKLNKKKKQCASADLWFRRLCSLLTSGGGVRRIRQMTQQLGMMEEQEQQHQQHVADEDDGGVSVRLLPRPRKF